MSRFLPALGLGCIVACSSLPDAGSGVVALELLPPDTLAVTVGQTVTLRARALDLHGDSIEAPIFWRSPDTAFVTLDSVTGVLGGKSVGAARVQARVGTLVSVILTFTVRAADSTSTGGVRARP